MAIAPSPARPAEGVMGAPVVARSEAPPNPWPRRAWWALGIVVAIVIGFRLTAGYPSQWVVNVKHWVGLVENWVTENQKTSWIFVDVITPLKSALRSGIDGVSTVLNRMTYVGVIIAGASIAGAVAGWRMAVLAFAGFIGLGLFGLWEASMDTLALILVSVGVALLIGIPLGVWAGRNPRVERVLRPVLDGMQTIPAYSYLLPIVLFFGIGSAAALVATVIFALPPAVRLTSLGVQGVPLTSLEVADSFGSTPRQRLRKVQLPLAKPSIMLGVNQTIMMALGMVVIAAIVGAGGLGREVYNGLQHTDVGVALNGGITIVIMAIVLDRVSYAWSQRNRRRTGTDVKLFGRSITQRLALGAAGLVTIAAVIIGRQVLRQQTFPTAWTVSVARPTNAVIDWIELHLSGLTGRISDYLVRDALDPIRNLLQGIPWWMVAGGIALLGWRVSRRWGLAVTCFACIAAIGVLGMWSIAMDTLSQVVVGVTLSILIAVPLGVWSAQSDRVRSVLKPLLDTMQTMPAFVYLVPVIALFHVGRVPGVAAAVIYALPPCIRLTDLGIRQVPNEITEAARSYGATRWQMLRKVELPLARPSILLGINQTIMMVLSVVIIAGLIGGGGLGLEAIVGLTHDETARGVVAGLCIMLLAIVIDRITQAMGMAPRAMRGPVGTGGMGWWTRVRAITTKPRTTVGEENG